MNKEQLKHKIDYLILECKILENDIFTDQNSYYSWINVKTNAKIAQINSKNTGNINYLVIVLAISSLMVSLISVYLTLVGSDNISPINTLILLIIIFLLLGLITFNLTILNSITSKKNRILLEKLFVLREFLIEYLK
jgi:pilus assembly protein TadC